jgi:hypothetical protein
MSVIITVLHVLMVVGATVFVVESFRGLAALMQCFRAALRVRREQGVPWSGVTLNAALLTAISEDPIYREAQKRFKRSWWGGLRAWVVVFGLGLLTKTLE